jgi:O-succinylbenzoic acid--CoA ligase
MPPAKLLARIPVPPGAAGPERLLPALAAALDGSGPAIAPVPTTSATTSDEYVASILRAVRADDPSHPLESDEVAAVIATSGSTGEPRGVLLTASQLNSMSDVVNGAGARPQWIVALPVTSMGGINVLVRALAADRTPIVMASVGGAAPFTTQAFRDAVALATSVTEDVRVSLVPAQVSRLLTDDATIEALRGCRQVLVGAAPTRPSLLAMARELGISLTTTYGATETSGGCVFDGRPLDGVRVEATEGGILVVRGPNVALGYRADPEATRAGFPDGAFRSPDVGTVAEDGTVTVIGRADDVVIVNGINVSPIAVERVVADLPDVVAAAVVATARGGGPVLHVFVEVREAAPDLEAAVEASVEQRLGRAARPGRLWRVPALPHLPNGKVDRRLLLEWADRGRTE